MPLKPFSVVQWHMQLQLRTSSNDNGTVDEAIICLTVQRQGSSSSSSGSGGSGTCSCDYALAAMTMEQSMRQLCASLCSGREQH